MLKRYLAIIFVLTVIVFTACKKEGPAGPAGPQGPTGNANVKTVILNVDSDEWVYEPGLAYVSRNVPEITSNIFDNGSVMAYWSINSSWVALPLTFPSDSITKTMGYNYYTGAIRLFLTHSDNTTPANLGTATFKLVLTSGS
jgi:hypothetical protein